MGGLLAFIAVSLVVIVTPGQDTALTVRNTLLGGRPAGLATAAGVSAGQAFWTLAASAGVTGLLVASEPAFVVLKLAGAAYLVWLGAQSLRIAIRGGPAEAGAAGPVEAGLPRRRAARQGFVSNLGNPKMALFFTSLLPQFAPHHGATFVPLLALGLLFCLLTLTWLSLYAATVARARSWLGRRSARRALEAVTGTALVALGLRLATERG
ncbi:MAG: LysE family translocator [Thermoleophilaceae bacterium]